METMGANAVPDSNMSFDFGTEGQRCCAGTPVATGTPMESDVSTSAGTSQQVLPDSDGRQLSSYSFWEKFKACKCACKRRYIDQLVPNVEPTQLQFGSVIHSCLELYHGGGIPDTHGDYIGLCYAHIIEGAYPPLSADKHIIELRERAYAMMAGYHARYDGDHSFVPAVINGKPALEVSFNVPIVNPATGAESRTFRLVGKVDGIVMKDGKYWILEHKTASTIDEAYISKLWCDTQTILYSHCISQQYNLPIAGVIYNVLAKTRLEMKVGESEFEFEQRKRDMKCPNRAKRQMPESTQEYYARLCEWYTRPEAFYRTELLTDRDDINELLEDLWSLTQEYLHCRSRDAWGKNRTACWHNRVPCEYFPLCSSGNSPAVLADRYHTSKPFGEVDLDQAVLGGTITAIENDLDDLSF